MARNRKVGGKMKLEKENKELKEINEQHKKINGLLREENKELKELRDVFTSGVNFGYKYQNIFDEFELWLEKRLSIKPMLTTYFFEMDGRKTSITEIEEKELSLVLDKLQELKGKR